MNNLSIEFINTKWYLNHEIYLDPLGDDSMIREFCEKWGIDTNEEDIDSDRLKTLRSHLANAVNDLFLLKKISHGNLTYLNEYLSKIYFYKSIGKEGSTYHIEEKILNENINSIEIAVMNSFISLITENALENIKLCENPDCKWIFYDESKNHSRKWCDNKCASLMKVRKYRKRKKLNSK